MSTLRIGIIGAGGNTRGRHIPGFRDLDDVEVVAVANRSLVSAEAAAAELDIPTAYASWRELLADPAIDAVCIGTYPDTHAPITIAALAAGKHVLCEARMARTYADAVAMDEAHRARPDLVAQIVPAPFTLQADAPIRRLIASGKIGRLVSAELRFGQGPSDPTRPLTWREDPAISGVNAMALGIHYEAALRWLGPAVRVTARSQLLTTVRPDGRGGSRALSIPDHLEVMAELASGATLNLRVSTAIAADEGDGIHLHGTTGSLHLVGRKLTLQRSDRDPEDVPLADGDGWNVETQFVDSIRDGVPVRLTDFATGRHYMAFSEAVLRAAANNSWEPVPPL